MLENEDRNCGCGCENNNMNNCCNSNVNTSMLNNNMVETNTANYAMMNTNMSDYDCNYDVQGINAAFGYNTVGLTQEDDNCSCEPGVREEMLHRLKCLNFAIIELGLYLNTHNNDKQAICLHREYTRQYKELLDKYQKVYGPLSIYFPCNKWRWLEEPWPWEGGKD